MLHMVKTVNCSFPKRLGPLKAKPYLHQLSSPRSQRNVFRLSAGTSRSSSTTYLRLIFRPTCTFPHAQEIKPAITMQVQPRMQSPMYHPHAHPAPENQNHAHTNGAHSDSRSRYSASTNGHINGDDMHPYQNQNLYPGGNGPPQQRQQWHPNQPNQLPPMHPSMSMPPPPGPSTGGHSGAAHPTIYPASHLAQPPPPPAQGSSSTQTQDGLRTLAGDNGKYRFELRVEQQPQRARMCGFGDKDRRPITPPPCVRLVVTDLQTGEPVPHEDVDGSFFILQVDLWDDTATREVNIVRSSSASPAVSISTATTTSYPPTPDRPAYGDYQQVLYTAPDGHQMYGPPPPGYHPQMMAPRPPMPVQGYPGYYQQQPYPNMPGQPMPLMPGPSPVAAPQQNHSMFTRNLIGSLTVNACPLKDTDGKTSYWFVLQDLSVRTEGWFR